MTFKSGFVNIIGRPNAGKSTLLNALVGEKMVIVSPKPQTTRHRIFAILNRENCQIVFSDTPGMIRDPRYRMQEKMNRFVEGTFEDADLFLMVVTPEEEYEAGDPVFEKFRNARCPVYLVINKMDESRQDILLGLVEKWKELHPFDAIYITSALHQFNTKELLEDIIGTLPEGPPYYPDDQISDRSERFFASEIIRENIMTLYAQEIPYSCEVAIESFKETTSKNGPLLRIQAVIYVSRESQKPIVIGKQGKMLKELGISSRKGLEDFFQMQVFLELFVKVKENWRDDDKSLRQFGYDAG
jgi:GTP-binding protein Era